MRRALDLLMVAAAMGAGGAIPAPRPSQRPNSTPEDWAEHDRQAEDNRRLAALPEEELKAELAARALATPKGAKAAAKRERLRQRNLTLAAKGGTP